MESRTRAPIQSDFTTAFQARYCLSMAAGSIVTSLLFYVYFDRGMGEGYFQSMLTLRHLEHAFAFSLLATFLFQFILIVALSIAINLFVSHKIAGPVYRYELALRNILKGELRADVRTRQGDQLKPLVDSFNHLLGSLRRLFSSARDLHQAVEENIDRLSAGEEAETEVLLRQIADVRWLMGAYSPRRRRAATDADLGETGAAWKEEDASSVPSLDLEPGQRP